ncbi:mandelate racemase/muconate lactonizing enzyme family protein [Rubrimonas sp.]|uniref:mandelate racemase/muconate lactonizing enzyme family protein n=1 Tax=Rubrimonas sp. TaxID=2036015 RepID=UPI002FDE159B
MQVTKVETVKAWVDWCNWLFVRVSTDEGLVGWGEGSLPGALRAVETNIHEIGEMLVGEDPAGPERHWHRHYHAWRWRGGAVGMTALSAIDLALWDIEGKRLGVPVHRLLGGAHRTKLRVYASHWLTGVRTPDAALEGAREARRRGFTAFKFIPATYEGLLADEAGEIALAAELMAAAREGAGPDAEIFIECAEFFSPRTIVLLDRALAPYRPGWFEEPLPFENARVMVQAQRTITTPIATGERLLSRAEFRELFEGGGCRVAQPDVMHCGGLTEARKIAAYADMHCIAVAPHNPAGPVSCAATMHLCASIPNFMILEQMEDQRAYRDRASSVPIRLEDGCFVLPDAPGLGVEPNLDVLAERPFRAHPIRERYGALWR